MPSTPIPVAIAEALQNLNKDDLDHFIFVLRHRADELKVSRSSVENKTILDITDVLLSTYTEFGALEVALKTLKQIKCNQEALRLELKTKEYMDKGDPTFRKTPNGELDTKPSQEAQNHVRFCRSVAATGPAAKTPKQVEAEAKALVLSEGGDSSNDRVVLSRYAIQFGQYTGKTFKWLLENDPSYVAKIVAGDQTGQMPQDPRMANKDALIRYIMVYPEVVKEVNFQRDYEKAKKESSLRGQAGKAFVGFGKYRTKTLKDLYESKGEDETRYIVYLRGMKSTCDPGSRMYDAIKYILWRDKQQAATKRRRTTATQFQSTRSQSTSRKIWTNQRSCRMR